MSAGGNREEHWLDRLATPHTRRHSFKATLAVAALTFPLARAAQARADNPNSSDPHACQKGCIYASDRTVLAAFAECERKRHFIQRGGAEFFLLGSLGGGLNAIGGAIALYGCNDNAILGAKARNWDCLQPGCPGFEPAGEWGPCRNCASINGCQCCPDSSSATGYTYCSSLSNHCCNPGGGCRTCGT